MKKIVLIGGHGFLGKNIQNEFENSPKYKILSISRRNGYDLIEKNKIRKFLEYEKPDYVINCAASVGSLDYVSTHPADIISYNIMIGINLWEILKEINYQGFVSAEALPLPDSSKAANHTIDCFNRYFKS